MAIFHFSAKVVGRSSGRSVVAAAAYRAGEKLRDERIGETFDYSRKRQVDPGEVLLPEGAPVEYLDRATLWNAVEQSENRKDAQLARDIEISLPMELSEKHAKRMAREFVQRNFVDQGMAADIAFHNLGKHNPHMHVLLTMRPVGAQGFGAKNRAWNAPALLTQWRSAWATHANLALERAKKEARIDARSLAAQHAEAIEKKDRLGAIVLDRPPQIHVGHKGNEDREAFNRNVQETALVTVALHAHQEEKLAEGLSANGWDQHHRWTDKLEKREAMVIEWKQVNPRRVSLWAKLGKIPAALKKLIEERDKAEATVSKWSRAIDNVDRAKKQARDLATIFEIRAAEWRAPKTAPQMAPKPVLSPSRDLGPIEGAPTPEEARKRALKR